MVPINSAPVTRTPGRLDDSAKPSLMSQCTIYGSRKRSRRNPNPGIMVANPQGWTQGQ